MFYLTLLLLCYGNVSASDSTSFLNNIRLSVLGHYGFVTPHNSSITYSLESNIGGIEIDMTTDTYGRTAWDKSYRYPRFGIGYLYTTLGNDEVFGHANSLFLFSDIAFIKNRSPFTVGYRLSLGIAYLNKTFDIEDNPLNLAIGSGINVHVDGKITLRYSLNYRNEIAGALGFVHFSNGKMSTPNRGINTFVVSLGYNYNLKPARYPIKTDTERPELKKNNVEIVLSYGAKADDQLSDKLYAISSLVTDYKRRIGLKYSAGLGLDFFYDEALGPNKVDDEGGEYTKADLYQIGLHGGFFASYSKLTVVINIGKYIHANYYKYTSFYSRIGIRYEVYRNVLFNITIKAHYAIADYLEWGIGYRF
ncbi:MAG: acyloxyacyl hydrolase [Bacteroidales bacterium]|nr:acyloxyacyl hydrolase [Bacteroidales bacterium]